MNPKYLLYLLSSIISFSSIISQIHYLSIHRLSISLYDQSILIIISYSKLLRQKQNYNFIDLSDYLYIKPLNRNALILKQFKTQRMQIFHRRSHRSFHGNKQIAFDKIMPLKCCTQVYKQYAVNLTALSRASNAVNVRSKRY